MRVAVGNDVQLPLVCYNAAETVAAPDALPSLTVLDEFGTAVAVGPVTLGSTGHYTAKLTSQVSPTILLVEWLYVIGGMTRRVTYPVHVDEDYLFEIHELRAVQGLEDATRYPTDVLEGVRDDVTAFFNDFCQTAFVGTYAREVFDGRNRRTQYLNYWPSRKIVRIIVNGLAVDFSGFKILNNGLVRSSKAWTSHTTVGQNVEVGYVYGMKHTPGDVRRAAIRCASTWLLESQGSIPDRARMMTTQWATFQLSTANEEYPTGIPYVDSVLRRYRLWVPSFA